MCEIAQPAAAAVLDARLRGHDGFREGGNPEKRHVTLSAFTPRVLLSSAAHVRREGGEQ